jgi:energy-coupling factor transport system substrate-specific component
MGSWMAVRDRLWARLIDKGGENIARQGVRFIVAGSTASAVNWLTRLASSFVVSFPVALVIGACLGMAVGFVLYRGWVFPGSMRRLREQTALFLLVNAVTACFVIGVSLLIASLLTGLPVSVRNQQNIAHAAAIGFGAIISFIGHRTFSFARRGPIP